jgi:hypothetical protein
VKFRSDFSPQRHDEHDEIQIIIFRLNVVTVVPSWFKYLLFNSRNSAKSAVGRLSAAHLLRPKKFLAAAIPRTKITV